MLSRMSLQPALRDEELRACALLARAPALHADHLRPLFRRGASIVDIAALPADELAQFAMPPLALRWLQAPDERQLESDLCWLAQSDTTLLHWDAAGYPTQLRNIDAPPLVLYVRGDAGALRMPQLAMVGSRRPTGPGRDTARSFATALARAGLTITSGLARGIDAAAHEGALLAGGTTVAVCGTGLDEVYPAEHSELAQRIAAQGALVSEFPPGTLPQRHNFPRRNRLISGLSRGTLVVEAALASGSLITARLAGEQGREVFAIPGSIHSPLSYSCHQLIRAGMAALVTSPAEVLEGLDIPFQKQPLTEQQNRTAGAAATADGMDKDYEILLDALGFEPASVDTLVDRSGLPSAAIASMLLILELDGRVDPQPGGRYCRRP
jgi:DNA processing protein